MKSQGGVFAGVGALASALGAFFSAFSSADYARHLDRGLHGTHCSFLPGIVAADSADSGCTAAMYSPYSAVLKDAYWGGIPISLFGLGAFSFLFALSLYFALSGAAASKRARQGYLLASVFPVLASVTMLVISLTQVGELCKLCVGVYVASALLFIAAALVLRAGGKSQPSDPERTVADTVPWHQRDAADEKRARGPVPLGTLGAALLPLFGLGAATALPGVVYGATMPSYGEHIEGCGTLAKLPEDKTAVRKLTTRDPKQPILSFEDPLCPACKSLHDRLVSGGLYEKLEPTVSIFPLDSECNWMVSRSLHPGACMLSRAFLCAEDGEGARAVLEWSYANQEELTKLGKDDQEGLKRRILGRFPDVSSCIDDKATKKRLEAALRYAVENKIRVSTPQVFVGQKRLCDEDTDMGLLFAMRHLSPELVKP